MARVSRRTNKITPVQSAEAIKIWNTALYGRLSVMETRWNSCQTISEERRSFV